MDLGIEVPPGEHVRVVDERPHHRHDTRVPWEPTTIAEQGVLGREAPADVGRLRVEPEVQLHLWRGRGTVA